MAIERKNIDRATIVSTTEYDNPIQRKYDLVGNSLQDNALGIMPGARWKIGDNVSDYNLISQIEDKNFAPTLDTIDTTRWTVTTAQAANNAALSPEFTVPQGTKFVVQSVGADQKPSIVYDLSSGTATPIKVFEDYTFIEAPSDGPFAIQFAGVTGQIYTNDGQYYLHSYEGSPATAYVFLSTEPWYVDINGFIVGHQQGRIKGGAPMPVPGQEVMTDEEALALFHETTPVAFFTTEGENVFFNVKADEKLKDPRFTGWLEEKGYSIRIHTDPVRESSLARTRNNIFLREDGSKDSRIETTKSSINWTLNGVSALNFSPKYSNLDKEKIDALYRIKRADFIYTNEFGKECNDFRMKHIKWPHYDIDDGIHLLLDPINMKTNFIYRMALMGSGASNELNTHAVCFVLYQDTGRSEDPIRQTKEISRYSKSIQISNGLIDVDVENLKTRKQRIKFNKPSAASTTTFILR